MLSVEKRDFRHYIWLKRASQERKYRNQPKNWFRIGCYIVSSVGKVLDNVNRTGISKAGNSHLRTLLIEGARGICKGKIGHKSKDLRLRQAGNSAEVIAYADKANVRLRSRYYRFMRHEKKKNVAVAAIARELACFIWGMMTDNISIVPERGKQNVA